jgi:hypothetical protein
MRKRALPPGSGCSTGWPDKAMLTAYHLPDPGKGRVERDGAVFRFVAIE